MMATFFMGTLRGILVLLYAEMAGDVQGMKGWTED